MSFHLKYVVDMSIFSFHVLLFATFDLGLVVVYLKLGLDLVFDPLMISDSISPVFSI